MTDTDAPITLIAILGMEHSGSTLLARVLGAHTDAFSLGGLKNYPAFAQGQKACSCGQSASDCPIWSGVADRLIADGHNTDMIARALGVRGSTDARAATPILLRALSAASGSRILIESSRRAGWTQDLTDAQDIRAVPVHIFKTPEQQVASARRKGRSVWKEMRKYDSRSRGCRSARYTDAAPFPLPYSEFCENPRPFVDAIMARAGVTTQDQQTTTWGEVPVHMLGGNRMKASKASLIAADTSWQTELTVFEARMARLIAGRAYKRNKGMRPV